MLFKDLIDGDEFYWAGDSERKACIKDGPRQYHFKNGDSFELPHAYIAIEPLFLQKTGPSDSDCDSNGQA